jgi:predicted enzyme related to lactoylglutathione lyase
MAKRKTAGVTGIGGIFFKSSDPAVLGSWYRNHLGVPVEGWGGAAFTWREHAQPTRTGYTVWSPFTADTQYFAPSTQPFMVNFRVGDLDALRASLIAAGVEVDPRVEESEFGRFGWCMDPDGNRIELWEPPVQKPVRKKAKPKAKPKPKAAAKRKPMRRGGR